MNNDFINLKVLFFFEFSLRLAVRRCADHQKKKVSVFLSHRRVAGRSYTIMIWLPSIMYVDPHSYTKTHYVLLNVHILFSWPRIVLRGSIYFAIKRGYWAEICLVPMLWQFLQISFVFQQKYIVQQTRFSLRSVHFPLIWRCIWPAPLILFNPLYCHDFD